MIHSSSFSTSERRLCHFETPKQPEIVTHPKESVPVTTYFLKEKVGARKEEIDDKLGKLQDQVHGGLKVLNAALKVGTGRPLDPKNLEDIVNALKGITTYMPGIQMDTILKIGKTAAKGLGADHPSVAALRTEYMRLDGLRISQSQQTSQSQNVTLNINTAPQAAPAAPQAAKESLTPQEGWEERINQLFSELVSNQMKIDGLKRNPANNEQIERLVVDRKTIIKTINTIVTDIRNPSNGVEAVTKEKSTAFLQQQLSQYRSILRGYAVDVKKGELKVV